MSRLIPLLAASILLLTAAAKPNHVKIKKPWIRAAPADAHMTAGYLKLKNSGNQSLVLEHVNCDSSAATEIHKTVVGSDGLMEMQEVETLEIPAKETLEFKPGGLHLMLKKLTTPMAAGTQVRCTLFFAQGLTIEQTFKVKNP